MTMPSFSLIYGTVVVPAKRNHAVPGLPTSMFRRILALVGIENIKIY